MKKELVLIAAVVLLAIYGFDKKSNISAKDPHSLFQASTFNVLASGIVKGNVSVGELKSNGNVGIGTFNSFSGELIMVNGVVYKISADGKVVIAKDDALTPFAISGYIPKAKTDSVSNIDSVGALNSFLENRFIDKNGFYLLRIDGDFETVTASCIDTAMNHRDYVFNKIKGIIVGLYCPVWAKGLDVAGFHFHYINADHSGGGHLDACKIRKANVFIQKIDYLRISLPTGKSVIDLKVNNR